MKLMKRNLQLLFLAVFVSAASCSFTTKSFEDPDKDKLLIDLITYVLEKGHYKSTEINDEFSEEVYTKFIDGLDPVKRFLLAKDIEEFSAYKYVIDDQLKAKELSFFNTVYERLDMRMEEAKNLYADALSTPFDYDNNESINVDYDGLEYATSKKELLQRWRTQLKFSTISNYYDMLEEKSTIDKRKKEAADEGKEYIPTDNEGLSEAELEEKSRKSTETSLDEYFEFTDALERRDYFAIFLTSIVEQFDPHINYFAPPDRDRFDTWMSGKLEGIGASLQQKNDYITVMEVINGGPAWRGLLIKAEDQLIKVR